MQGLEFQHLAGKGEGGGGEENRSQLLFAPHASPPVPRESEAVTPIAGSSAIESGMAQAQG